MVIAVSVRGGVETERYIQSIERNLPGTGRKIVEGLAKVTVKRAKANIKPIYPPRGAQRLRKNIYYIMKRTGQGWDGIVKADSRDPYGHPYALYVEEGTRPHIQPNSIIPKFRTQGHPGAQGYPSQHFMKRAARSADRQMKGIVSIHMRRLLRSKGG